MTSAGYLRFPHLHDDLIAFTAEDDVWLAPVAGGRAWRVSADQAQASHPRISRDGTMVAWTCRRDGPPEVYLAGAEGGNERRLTYWGDPQTRVCGWDPARALLAITASGQPFSQFTWAYALSAGGEDGAGPRRLPFGPVSDLSVEQTGVALLTGCMGREPAHWKRYRGGTSGRLWLAPATAGQPDGAQPDDAQATAGPFTGFSVTWPATSPARCWPGAGSPSCPTTRAPATCTRARWTAAACGGTPTTTVSTPATRAPTGPGSFITVLAISGCLTPSTRRPSRGCWILTSARRPPGGPGGWSQLTTTSAR